MQYQCCLTYAPGSFTQNMIHVLITGEVKRNKSLCHSSYIDLTFKMPFLHGEGPHHINVWSLTNKISNQHGGH